jgi:hypothetical protein
MSTLGARARTILERDYIVLPQPNGSSMRFRFFWLTA